MTKYKILYFPLLTLMLLLFQQQASAQTHYAIVDALTSTPVSVCMGDTVELKLVPSGPGPHTYSSWNSTSPSLVYNAGDSAVFVASMPGSHNIGISFQDNSGMFYAFNIMIHVDNTPPQVTCPPNQVIPNPSNCNALIADYRDSAMVVDYCMTTTFQQPPPNSTFSGSQVVALTATDLSGLSGSCTFTLTTQFPTNRFKLNYKLDSSHIKPNSVTEMPCGDLIVCGEISLGDTNWAYISSTRPNGMLNWFKYLDFNGNSAAYSVASVDPDHFIITGYIKPTNSNADVFLSKINVQGNPVWTRLYGLGGDDLGNHVKVLNDGFLVTGCGTDTDSMSGPIDALVLRTNLSGTMTWGKLVDAGGYEVGKEVVRIGNHAYVIGFGCGTSINSSISGASFDILTLRINLADGSSPIIRFLGDSTSSIKGSSWVEKNNELVATGTAYIDTTAKLIVSHISTSIFSIPPTGIPASYFGSFSPVMGERIIQNDSGFAIAGRIGNNGHLLALGSQGVTPLWAYRYPTQVQPAVLKGLSISTEGLVAVGPGIVGNLSTEVLLQTDAIGSNGCEVADSLTNTSGFLEVITPSIEVKNLVSSPTLINTQSLVPVVNTLCTPN